MKAEDGKISDMIKTQLKNKGPAVSLYTLTSLHIQIVYLLLIEVTGILLLAYINHIYA